MYDAQLHANAARASQLGISGTPGWVIGDQALNGAVGREKLGQAIEAARQS
jgi:protein-disulfide isomerase